MLNYISWNSNPISLNSRTPSPLEKSDLITKLVTKDNLGDVGNAIPINLYTNITDKISLKSPYLEIPGYKYYDLAINTNSQNITKTNLSFSGFSAKDASIVLEDNPENFRHNVGPTGKLIFAAMSFKVPSPCKLKQARLFVQEMDINDNWIIYVYNATRILSENLALNPDKFTGIVTVQTATNPTINMAAHWQNFTFPTNPQLNVSKTFIDSKGFAYYFFVIILPLFNVSRSNYAFLYYANDTEYVDAGYAYEGIQDISFAYVPIDFCIKIDLAPLSPKPSPSAVSLAIMNPSRPAPTTMTIEANNSVPVDAAYNYSGGVRILAQNFTLSDYGTLSKIGLYARGYNFNGTSTLAIFSDNKSKPNWDANHLLDLNVTVYLHYRTKGWINFTMSDLPNLPPGKYWWVLIVEGKGNLTLYGASDSCGNNATALNTTYTIGFRYQNLTYDFATIIYYQPGKEFFNISKNWISYAHFLPDNLGNVHFHLLTRWLGYTAFNVTYKVELENNLFSSPYYIAYFSENIIWWEISLSLSFVSTKLGKVINLTIPLDWTVYNVTRNGRNHGTGNWSLYRLTNRKVLSIVNASNGQWAIFCNSPIYSLTFTIQKFVGTQFQSAANATVYDRIRVNITIRKQNNGNCYLTILYPDRHSSFINHTAIKSENIFLLWYPENDTDATGGNYTFIVHWSNGTEVGYNRQYFLFIPIPASLTLLSAPPSPYVSDTTKTVLIRYYDSRGVNITGATVFARLNGISLEWEDLYSKSLKIPDKGLYRIKLNTTGLNANQNYTLNAWAFKEGYENVTIIPQKVLVLPVPTSLNVNVKNITQYQNQFISFSCSYKDIFHGIGIDWALIKYNIIGTNINGSLINIMPNESIYVASNVWLQNLIGQATPYQINVTATAFNCAPKYTIIDLFILNKTRTNLTLIITPRPLILGQSMPIKAILTNTSSHQGISNATIRFTFGGVISDRIALTNGSGIAETEVPIPDQSFVVQAQYDETYNIGGAVASPKTITILPYSTSLVTNAENIMQYENEQITLSCSYKDLFHGRDIDSGLITYNIIGTKLSGTLTNNKPEKIWLTNISGHAIPYQINITAIAVNCDPKSKIINLFVLNKTRVNLIIFTDNGPFIQGQIMHIKVLLQNETSHSGIPNATIRFSFGGVISERIALTDNNGIAEIEISVPGQNFQIEAEFDGLLNINSGIVKSEIISIITYADIGIWIGIVAAVFIASAIAVRQLYLVPKRKHKTQRYQKIANKFQDVANLRQILIIHKDSGTCIFQQSFIGKLDGDLISGFLYAISSFQTELKPEKLTQKGSKSGGFELNYQDYKILLFEGTLIRLALVVEETPSDEFRKLAQSLVGEYEANYRAYLIDWRGDATPFKTSDQFISKKLEISLVWPHQLRKPAPSEKLTSLEESIIKIADTIMKSQATNYFFLPMVISMGQAGAPQAKLEIIATVYNLRYRDIFNPVNPSSLTA